MANPKLPVRPICTVLEPELPNAYNPAEATDRFDKIFT
jgi:hypothetical protein